MEEGLGMRLSIVPNPYQPRTLELGTSHTRKYGCIMENSQRILIRPPLHLHVDVSLSSA